MRLVQLNRRDERRVALVDGSNLHLLFANYSSIYALANKALDKGTALTELVSTAVSGQALEYESIYQGQSDWRILPSFDHPEDAAHSLVSGTGLTHKASARNRAAMHTETAAEMTDSYRMFQMGLAGGSPPAGSIGVQPEWFYKGDGSAIRGHGDRLTIPAYAEDGGEEPEIAGVYLISASGEPVRVGLTVANEFSDHKMEKQNYLYLAPSKLRECSIGPEITVGPFAFDDVPGKVSIVREGAMVWSSEIWTGETNMSHSVANLEHHHFKYQPHRHAGDVHIHFYGADAFSFGAGVSLLEGDLMEVSFPKFGRPLQNTLSVAVEEQRTISVRQL